MGSPEYHRFIEYFTQEHEPRYAQHTAIRLARLLLSSQVDLQKQISVQVQVDNFDRLTEAQISSDRVFYPKLVLEQTDEVNNHLRQNYEEN